MNSFIGNQPATSFDTVRKQVSTSNSGTTITLDYPVTSVADIRLTINAVVQSYDNYSVSGSTLTVGGTLNNDRVEILFVGRTYGSIIPSDASVGLNQLSATGTASSSTFLRGDNSWASAGTTINNNADNRVITGSGTANTLEGEANLTYDGAVLKVLGDPSTVIGQPYNLQLENNTDGATSGDAKTGILFRASYNDTTPTDMAGITAGKENNTNGEYGSFISLNTRTNGVNTIAERMRITSSGKLLVGETSSDNGVIEVKSSTTNSYKGYFANSTANYQNMRLYSDVGGTETETFRIENDGDVKNTNNSYGSISDERIKQDITDANSQWEDIKNLKIKNYKRKDQVAEGLDISMIGVVAQDLEKSGMSGLVSESIPSTGEIRANPDFGTLENKVDADGNIEGVKAIPKKDVTVKSVKYSVLYMKSIKALQEAITKIETLEARVKTLEEA